jgi:O-antigen/teichoic acid export membrane protein
MVRAQPYLWALVERVAPMAVSFVVSIIVARMVAPAAYGLVAMLSVFMALGQAFTELGFGASLVQRREITADDETTVFVINLAAGLIITATLCAISPLVALFMRQETLTKLLCVQSLGILIASTGLVQFAKLSRQMDFHVGAAIELAGTFVSGVVGIGMARAGLGVWSLVGLALSREIIRTSAAWLLIGWRPSGRFSKTRAASMWAYSGKLLYSSLFHRFVTNLYSILIGRIYAPAALGLYTRAISFQSLPSGLIVGIVQRVAFPLFSRHQDDKALLLRTLRRQIRLLALSISAVMGVLAAIASDLVPWLLGSRWAGAAPLLEILCIGGVLASLFPLHSQMTMALGESAIFLRVEMLKKIVILVVLAAVYRFGLEAFAWGAVATSVADYCLSAWPTTRLLGYSWRMQLADIVPAALLSGIPALVLLHTSWPDTWAAPALMGAKALLFGIVIGGGIWLLRGSCFSDAWSLLRLRRA